MLITITLKKFIKLTKAFAEKKSDSYSVPQFMQKAAAQGLKIREKLPPSKRGGTPTGIARARDLSNGKNVSLSTVKRIKQFASRHGANYKAKYDKTDKWWQGMMFWGVPYSSSPATAKKNINKVINWANRIINSK